jgi:hypothetical protein
MLSKERILLLNYPYKLLVYFLWNSVSSNIFGAQLENTILKSEKTFIFGQNFIPKVTFILERKKYYYY